MFKKNVYKSMTPNLMVEDVAQTIEFYARLGFAAVDSVPKEGGGLQFAIVVKDNMTLMFEDRAVLIEEYPILDTVKTQPSISLYIVVNNVNAYYEQIKGEFSVLNALHKTFYGSDEFAIADNNGYVLTFTQAY